MTSMAQEFLYKRAIADRAIRSPSGVTRKELRALQFQLEGANVTDRMNVINFDSLFFGDCGRHAANDFRLPALHVLAELSQLQVVKLG
jgi:hypothetical protein